MDRDRCTAHRRDGQPCEAPAVEFATVCRRHGGAAPQVQRAAERMRRQMCLYSAVEEWREAQGTNREFERLCAVGEAERALDDYEAKLAELSWLRAELARRKPRPGSAAASPKRPASGSRSQPEPDSASRHPVPGGAERDGDVRPDEDSANAELARLMTAITPTAGSGNSAPAEADTRARGTRPSPFS